MSQAVTESPDSSGSSIHSAIDSYINAEMPLDVPHIEIATWIVNQGLFDLPFETHLKVCDKQVAEALRSATRVDSQGRTVRKYVCYRAPYQGDGDAKAAQKWLWADAFNVSANHAHTAALAMRMAIGKDCCSLKATVASMNENNPNLRDHPIQLSWDFTDEVEGDGSADPRKPR